MPAVAISALPMFPFSEKRTAEIWLSYLEQSLLVLLVLSAGSLLWLSLRWPMVGDAGIYHLIAVQTFLGAVPYRDVADINMPLIYEIHRIIATVGGLGDGAFRVFDVSAALAIGVLTAAFTRPAGVIRCAVAGGAVILMHLAFGPHDAGQRDFLLLALVLLNVMCSVEAIRRPRLQNVLLTAAGMAAGAGVLLKPTAAAFVLLPFVALGQVRIREAVSVISGFLAIIAGAVIVLYRADALGACFHVLREYLPVYSAFDRKPALQLAMKAALWALRLCGFVIPGLLTLRLPLGARERTALGIALCGVLHVLVQGKGYFYHMHPLILGMIVWGTLCLPQLSFRPAFVSVALIALSVAITGARGLQRAYTYTASARAIQSAQSSMEQALARYFPPGSRVEMFDAEAGGTLAMARSWLRMSTPDLYWMFTPPTRWGPENSLLAALRNSPPDGLLITKDRHGFAPAENWRELNDLIAARYILVASRDVSQRPSNPWDWGSAAAWRVYVRK
jgi:hypothetical protein